MSGGLSALGPIEQRTLADMVTARLRDAIMHSELEPGQRLKEPELATALGVSRSPIREALARLRGEGLVIGNASSYVWQPTRAQVNEVLSLQTALVVLAAEWIIAEQRVNDDDFVKLQSMIDDLRQTLKDPESVSSAATIAADEVFHGYLLRRSGLVLVMRLWRQTMSQWRVFMHTYLRHHDVLPIAQGLASEHQAILDALRDGDLDGIETRYGAENELRSERIQKVL